MSFTLEVTLAEQTEHMTPVYICVSVIAVKADFCFTFSSQLDADRDEEEVFCDISMTLDNKLFPSKEPAAGEMITAFYKTVRQLWSCFFYVQRGLITVQQDIYATTFIWFWFDLNSFEQIAGHLILFYFLSDSRNVQ